MESKNGASHNPFSFNDWMIPSIIKFKWNKYYNSKYIDAEETDVSRNQTSTWLIERAAVDEAEDIPRSKPPATIK